MQMCIYPHFHAAFTLYLFYRFIALAPNTPATAEATAMTTFRIISQRDFFIAITLHTSFPTLEMVNPFLKTHLSPQNTGMP